MKIEFKKVDRNFNEVKAVSRVTLEITPTTFVALVGPSGAGKSTLLKMINGLQTPDAGIVLLDDEDVALKPKAMLRRRIGYVFQSIGLFPHLTVSENIAIGPRLQKERVSEERMSELLQLLELEPGIGNRMPHELSGGQQQRVGIARALANTPQLLLMDEPFGALDPVTRAALGTRVKTLHQSLGLTTIMVTHDMTEALLLADRVLVMDRGSVVADEKPSALLSGKGGPKAQELVEVPRQQAEKLANVR